MTMYLTMRFAGPCCAGRLRQCMKVNVVSLEKAVAVYHNPQYQDETVFYLFTNPHDVLTMVRQGVQIATLNIGGMASATR